MPIQDRLPKSRITLTYRTTINGQEQEVALPFRVLVLGNFSNGTSSDYKTPEGKEIDLDERKIRAVTGGGKQLNKLMADMKMTLQLENEVPNAITGRPSFPVALKIDSMKSFHPDEIVKQVDQLRALRLMRNLLGSIQAKIDNNKNIRTWVEAQYKNPAAIPELQQALDARLVTSFQTNLDATVDYHKALKALVDDLKAALASNTTLLPKVTGVEGKFKALTDPTTLAQERKDAGTDAAKLTSVTGKLTALQTKLVELQTELETQVLQIPAPTTMTLASPVVAADITSTDTYQASLTTQIGALKSALTKGTVSDNVKTVHATLTALSDIKTLQQELTGADAKKLEEISATLRQRQDMLKALPRALLNLAQLPPRPSYTSLKLPQATSQA